MEVFQFDPRKKGRAYSKGNRQKVALIAAFATPADLYMLDEPTSGLDPLMEQVFNREIDRVAADGVDRAAVEPHPVRGRGALRPRDDHQRGQDRRERHHGRAAPPHPHRDRLFGATAMRDAVRRRSKARTTCSSIDGRVSFTVDSDRVAGVLPELARLDVEGPHASRRRRSRSSSSATTATSSPPVGTEAHGHDADSSCCSSSASAVTGCSCALGRRHGPARLRRRERGVRHLRRRAGPARDPRHRHRDPNDPRVPRHAERHRRRRLRVLPALRLARPDGRH